jgi:hypothetical protein
MTFAVFWPMVQEPIRVCSQDAYADGRVPDTGAAPRSDSASGDWAVLPLPVVQHVVAGVDGVGT